MAWATPRRVTTLPLDHSADDMHKLPSLPRREDLPVAANKTQAIDLQHQARMELDRIWVELSGNKRRFKKLKWLLDDVWYAVHKLQQDNSS